MELQNCLFLQINIKKQSDLIQGKFESLHKKEIVSKITFTSGSKIIAGIAYVSCAIGISKYDRIGIDKNSTYLLLQMLNLLIFETEHL